MGIVILHHPHKKLDHFQDSRSAAHRHKDNHGHESIRRQRNAFPADRSDDVLDRLQVCVTSGVSFLGIAIVKELLLNGFSVRVIVDAEEDVDKLRDMELNSIVEVIIAKLTDEVESLAEAFDGCSSVIHTASFVDPDGVSGYSKAMVNVEVNTTKNVIQACVASPSVQRCLLTSSLLTCIWRDDISLDEAPRVLDHNSWSDESVCITKKLWYALGKLRAEKAAQEIANEYGLNLTTICPGLIKGPGFYQRNPTPTIAYLKGFREMYANGVLATVGVNTLAKAHICILDDMKGTAASGSRYICFDRVIKKEDEVEMLAHEMGMDTSTIRGVSLGNRPDQSVPVVLFDSKMGRLMVKTLPPRCCNEC